MDVLSVQLYFSILNRMSYYCYYRSYEEDEVDNVIID